MISFFGFFALALVVTAVAAVRDVRSGHIPNWLTLGALGIAASAHLLQGFLQNGMPGLGHAALVAVMGAVLCGFAPLLAFRLAGMGGGDVKLFIALGVICGPMLGMQAQLYAVVVLATYAAAKLTYHGKLVRTLANAVLLAARPFSKKLRAQELAPEFLTTMRAGPAIFVGVLLAFLSSRGEL